MFDSGSAFALQARATALHDRWGQMLAQGVPASDLAALEQEWTSVERFRVLSVGSAFWWPGTSATLDNWQAQTSQIWMRNLTVTRAAAIAADENLHRALGMEPFIQRKERLAELAAATTPADFTALRAYWDLEAKLVPIDREIAADVGRLAGLAAEAKALGIVSDPAGGVIMDAGAYADLEPPARMAYAGHLMHEVRAVQQDLGARIDAATIAKQAFSQTDAMISRAIMYGIGVAPYQAQLDGDQATYAAAITAAQFIAITADLNQADGALQHVIDDLNAGVHIVSGVAFYYQAHALSCEETAMSMALTHQGIYLSQDQILAEMGADLRRQYRDANGTLRWGNPYISFVGWVNGIENVTGLQANYPPLVRVAQRHGASVIASGNMPVEGIYARIIAGHPVVVYATWDWAWHPRHDYLSFDGQWIPYIGPGASHVYTAIGVRPDAVLVNDPFRGQYWVGKRYFEAAYSDFSEAIVFA